MEVITWLTNCRPVFPSDQISIEFGDGDFSNLLEDTTLMHKKQDAPMFFKSSVSQKLLFQAELPRSTDQAFFVS